MVRCLRRAALLGVLVALLVSTPTLASAQLGALARRAARQAVQDRVEAALPFTPKEAPEFNDRVLEIDERFVERLIRGFEAEIAYSRTASGDYERQVTAYEQAVKDHERAREAYDRDIPRWQACADTFQAREAAASEANQARIDKAVEDMNDEELEKYAEEMAVRGERLAREIEAGKNDPATQRAWEAYQRELQVFTLEQQRRMMLAMSGAMAETRRATTEDPRLAEACGKRPEQPAQPQSPLSGPEGILIAQGSEAAGITAEQYSIMRERVIYWWEQERRPSGMGYSDMEIRALGAQGDALDAVLDRMKKARVPF